MRIAICDDVIEHQKECIDLIIKCAKKNDIEVEVIPFDNSEQLLFALAEKDQIIDLIYLDISMPGQNGVDAARQIRANGYPSEIIFFTQRDNCWKQAFTLRALHYIVKGEYTEEEFEEIFLMGVEEVRRNTEDTLLFTCAGESRNISINDIQYFEVHNHVVSVYYRNNLKFDFYTPLNKLERVLSKNAFIRCHKSYLIAKQYVEGVSLNEITMKNGDPVPVGRTYRSNVRENLIEKKA